MNKLEFLILNLAQLIYSYISFIPIIGWTNIFYTWEIPTSTLNKWQLAHYIFIPLLHGCYQPPLFCEIKGSLSRLQLKSHHQVMEICHLFTKHSYMLWINQNILYNYNNSFNLVWRKTLSYIYFVQSKLTKY